MPISDFLRTHVYVDGNNFLQSVQKQGGPRFIDFYVLARSVAQLEPSVREWVPGTECAVARLSYYDAEPDDTDPERQ